MIKEIFYVFSGNEFRSMLFAFMLVIITTEYMLPKSIFVSVLLYIFAVAIVLRPLVEEFSEDNNLNKKGGQ